MMLRLTAGLLALACVASAQRRVDPRNTYEPAICVVSVVGTGTMKDPKRPQFAPWPPTGAKSPNGIIAFSHQVSDEGKLALVEFVARDRSAFQQTFTVVDPVPIPEMLLARIFGASRNMLIYIS